MCKLTAKKVVPKSISKATSSLIFRFTKVNKKINHTFWEEETEADEGLHKALKGETLYKKFTDICADVFWKSHFWYQ